MMANTGMAMKSINESTIGLSFFVLCLVSSIQGRVGCAAAVFCDRVFGLLPTFA